MKTCTKCHQEKPVASFVRDRRAKTGFTSRCKACDLARNQKYRTENPEKRRISSRNSELKRLYGLTPEMYDALLSRQGGVCAGCGLSPNNKRLCVDHDHATGVVRGLLCGNCNMALGKVFDNVHTLTNLINYLNE